MKKILSILVILFVIASFTFAHESSTDSKVLDLGGDLEQRVSESDKPFFVMFYAPWCPHCKQLIPVWDQASIEYEDLANWAKIDCTVHEEICSSYQIQGYPSLKLFNDGAVHDYNNARSLDAFVNFIERMKRPPVTQVSTQDEFDAFIENKNSFVAFFGEEPQFSAFEQAAKHYQASLDCLATSDVSLGSAYGVKNAPALVSVNQDDTLTYTGKFEAESIRKWIARSRVGLFPELGPHNFQEVAHAGAPVVIVAIDPNDEDYENRMESGREVAKKYFDEFVVVWLDGVRWAQYLEGAYQISGDQVPIVVVLDTEKEIFYQRKTDTTEELSQFLDEVISGTAEPTQLNKGPKEPEGFQKYKIMTENFVGRYVWYSLSGAFIVGFVLAKILSFGGSSTKKTKKSKKD